MSEPAGPDTRNAGDEAARVAAAKALLRTIIERYWTSEAGMDELAAHIAPGYVHHAPLGELNWDQFRAGLAALRGLSPVLSYRVTHIIAEGDLYAVHVRSTISHSGAAGDIAPTGKVVECAGAYHCRMAGDKIVEDWDVWTIQPVFQQLLARLRA
jgi:predicted ester cyclase